MGKLSALFVTLSVIFAPIVGQALEISENGFLVGNVSDAKQFGAFSLSSYVEIVSAETTTIQGGHTITKIGYRLYFTKADRADMARLSPEALKTVYLLYSDLKSVKDIPGLDVLK